MGLGLHEPSELSTLRVVTSGAAKGEVFDDLGPGSELYHAYLGESLCVYDRPGDEGGQGARDMIATVMVASADKKGHFGNIPRRLIYAAQTSPKNSCGPSTPSPSRPTRRY